MALWGNADGAPFGSLTATIDGGSKNVITFSGTIASYGVNPGDTIIFDTGGGAAAQHLRVLSVDSTTQVTMTTEGTAASGKTCELQQAPKYTAIGDVTGKAIIGADVSETQAASPGSITHAGWIKKTTRVRQPGNVSATYFETLVAGGSITQDTVVQDLS